MFTVDRAVILPLVPPLGTAQSVGGLRHLSLPLTSQSVKGLSIASIARCLMRLATPKGVRPSASITFHHGRSEGRGRMGSLIQMKSGSLI